MSPRYDTEELAGVAAVELLLLSKLQEPLQGRRVAVAVRRDLWLPVQDS